MGKIVIAKNMFYFPEVPKNEFWVGRGGEGDKRGKVGIQQPFFFMDGLMVVQCGLKFRYSV